MLTSNGNITARTIFNGINTQLFQILHFIPLIITKTCTFLPESHKEPSKLCNSSYYKNSTYKEPSEDEPSLQAYSIPKLRVTKIRRHTRTEMLIMDGEKQQTVSVLYG